VDALQTAGRQFNSDLGLCLDLAKSLKSQGFGQAQRVEGAPCFDDPGEVAWSNM